MWQSSFVTEVEHSILEEFHSTNNAIGTAIRRHTDPQCIEKTAAS